MQALGKKHRYLTTTSVEVRPEVGGWILPGAVMGVAAGGVFLIFEMIAARVMSQSVFEPIRMIAAVILSGGALPTQSTIGLVFVVLVTLAVHHAFRGSTARYSVLPSRRSVLCAADMWRWRGLRASSVLSCGWPISARSHQRCFRGS